MTKVLPTHQALVHVRTLLRLTLATSLVVQSCNNRSIVVPCNQSEHYQNSKSSRAEKKKPILMHAGTNNKITCYSRHRLRIGANDSNSRPTNRADSASANAGISRPAREMTTTESSSSAMRNTEPTKQKVSNAQATAVLYKFSCTIVFLISPNTKNWRDRRPSAPGLLQPGLSRVQTRGGSAEKAGSESLKKTRGRSRLGLGHPVRGCGQNSRSVSAWSRSFLEGVLGQKFKFLTVCLKLSVWQSVVSVVAQLHSAAPLKFCLLLSIVVELCESVLRSIMCCDHAIWSACFGD